MAPVDTIRNISAQEIGNFCVKNPDQNHIKEEGKIPPFYPDHRLSLDQDPMGPHRSGPYILGDMVPSVKNGYEGTWAKLTHTFLLSSFHVLPSFCCLPLPPPPLLTPLLFLLSPHVCPFLKIMQQQAALMAAAQGTCLNPMAAIAAAQMQQMAAFNVSGLVAAPMTPSSGIYHAAVRVCSKGLRREDTRDSDWG